MTEQQPGATPPFSPPPQDGVPPYQTPPPPYGAPTQPARYQVVSDDQRAIWASKGKRSIAFGVVWLLAGLIITGITYSNASGPSGGVYIVAWGPMAYGVFSIISGYLKLNKAKR